MSTKNTWPKTFHVLVSGTTVIHDTFSNRVAYRGETFTVTEAQYEESKDRHGASWLDMTPAQQEARWGVQRFGAGPLPEGVEFGSDDIALLDHRRTQAIEYANAISDPAARAEAHRELKRRFGAPPLHSAHDSHL